MRAIVLERNKLVGRRLVRYFSSAGVETAVIEDPAQLGPAMPGAHQVRADTFDGDAVTHALRTHPGARGLLWTAEPLRRSLRHLVECSAINHVLGRKDFESAPRPWELMMVLRRAAEPQPQPPSISAYLDWGYTG